MNRELEIKELHVQIEALVESNNAKADYITELESINESLAEQLINLPEEVNSPENPLILNDILNSIIAKSVITIDKEGIDDFNLCELEIINSLKI